MQKLFNIPNDPQKRRVFDSLLAERFRGFKTHLTSGWIYKKKKHKKKSSKGNDGEGGNEEDVEEQDPPWKKWPSVTEDEWKDFVIQKTRPKAIVRTTKSNENCIIY